MNISIVKNFRVSPTLVSFSLAVSLSLIAISSFAATLEFSTFIGGSLTDYAYDIAINDNDELFTTGYTSSTDFPTTAGVVDTSQNGNVDAFISKFSSNGNSILYSTFIGGSSDEIDIDITVDINDNAFISGATYSSNYPTQNAYDSSYNGNIDAFVSKVSSDGSSLLFSTYFGGTNEDKSYDIFVDSNGFASITGYTSSSNFPKQNAYDSSINGAKDIFISGFSIDGTSLVYSTYIGGSTDDYGNGIYIDLSGNIYIAGFTTSDNFPTQNAYDSSKSGGWDGIVTKFSANCSSLIYSTFLGGSTVEECYSIAVDKNENVYVTGRTESTNFPTKNSFAPSFNGGNNDAFVTKFSADGTTLEYSSYLGGNLNEIGLSITVNPNGYAFVTGNTTSSNFPIQNPFDSTQNGDYDLFLTHISPLGTEVKFSSYFGGTQLDATTGNINKNGNLYVIARTSSTDFPTTNGSYDETYNGGTYDVGVVKFDLTSPEGLLSESTLDLGSVLVSNNSTATVKIYSTGTGNLTVSSHSFTNGTAFSTDLTTQTISEGDSSSFTITFTPTSETNFSDTLTIFTNDSDTPSYTLVLVGVGNLTSSLPSFYATYLGGNDTDSGYGIDVSENEIPIITGYSLSSDFPITSGAFEEIQNGNEDVVVTKLSSDGSSLAYSTFIGGSSEEKGYDISIDENGNAFLTGYSSSTDFPTQNALDSSQNGNEDAFVCKLSSDGSSLAYSTFIGGSDLDKSWGISIDSNGNAYITGYTASTDFPTQNAFSNSYAGGTYDVFVSKLSSEGSSLSYSTYLGGLGIDESFGIAVDQNGSAYVTGSTASINFPVQNAYDNSYGSGYDVFVTKFSTNGTLTYSTFLGGSSFEIGYAITVDQNENAFVTGRTSSGNFPTLNAYDSSFNGGVNDAFVTKLSVSGTSLEFSTLLGGTDSEVGFGISTDDNGNAYVSGYTLSSDFPIQNGLASVLLGTNDLFISQINSSGNSLEYSTFIGGTGEDQQGGTGNHVIYKNGNIYLSASTTSTDFPTSNGAFSQSYNGGTYDAVIVKINIQTTQDSISPSSINNFKLMEHNGTNIKLHWVATGDDTTNGTATNYEIRQSTSEITEANFSSAILLSNIPTPSASGISDSVTVTGLTSGVQYYFGIKAIDNSGNESPLSTVTSFGRAEFIAISDIQNDNGGQVRIEFDASLNDYNTTTGLNVSSYTIFRKINSNFSPASKPSNQIFEGLPNGNWEQISNFQAFGDQSYIVVVPTLADSNSTGINDFEFLIRTQAFGMPWINSVSESMNGYSVDNLPPTIPPNQNFVNNGNGTTSATWNSVYDSDLANYSLWAELAPDDFVFQQLITPTSSGTQNLTFGNVSGAISYAVGSIDLNGNESLPFANRISSLEIEIIGNDVVLNWVGKISATVYKVYRSENADLSNSTQIGTYTPNGISPSFIDFGVAQNADKYFYFVTWEY